ncbi:hypothetical protein MVEN_02214400 [Mycena venus]|uniref:Uncharacterized protein n=1 Tax=Mycena venus TaxID=2733690 RepID=A0A8H6X7R6_9AGAR|nr:hypothetical protein MVEN_02214400 [Mycena venus]
MIMPLRLLLSICRTPPILPVRPQLLVPSLRRRSNGSGGREINVENLLAFLGDPKGPTTRAEFVAGTSAGPVKKEPSARSNKTDQQSGDGTKALPNNRVFIKLWYNRSIEQFRSIFPLQVFMSCASYDQ